MKEKIKIVINILQLIVLTVFTVTFVIYAVNLANNSRQNAKAYNALKTEVEQLKANKKSIGEYSEIYEYAYDKDGNLVKETVWIYE